MNLFEINVTFTVQNLTFLSHQMNDSSCHTSVAKSRGGDCIGPKKQVKSFVLIRIQIDYPPVR